MAKEILMSGTVGYEINVEDTAAALAEANGEDIKFLLSSGGGSVFQGLAIANLIKNYSGHTTAHIIGIAASMATKIAISADTVTAEDDAVFMIHNASGIVVGDSGDMAKMAKTLNSIDDLLARSYALKTGRPKAELREDMSNETFLFGNEIKKAGFADAIITGKGKDKKAALDDATLEIKAAIETIKTLEIKDDYDQIAALLPEAGSEKIHNTSRLEQRESANSNNSHKGKIMPFEDFLKENPQFKAEIDSALADEKTAGKAEMKEEFYAKVAKVATIIESDAYNAKIKSLAIKALKGEISAETLDVVIAMHDTGEETKASDEARAEQPEDTPPDDTVLSTDGSLRNEADIQAYISRKKGGK